MHPKIQQWLDACKRIEEAMIFQEVTLNEAINIPAPPEEHLREATSDDVRVGNVFWYLRDKEQHGSYWILINEVYRPNDPWKAFCGHDGCRYGLEGAMVEIEQPIKQKETHLIEDESMLRHAAIAAGISGYVSKASRGGYDEEYFIPAIFYYNDGRRDNYDKAWWNPILDDRDAFSLAIKLELDILCASVRSVEDGIEIPIQAGVDPNAATRRAITTVAAMIGKSMLDEI